MVVVRLPTMVRLVCSGELRLVTGNESALHSTVAGAHSAPVLFSTLGCVSD